MSRTPQGVGLKNLIRTFHIDFLIVNNPPTNFYFSERFKDSDWLKFSNGKPSAQWSNGKVMAHQTRLWAVLALVITDMRRLLFSLDP